MQPFLQAAGMLDIFNLHKCTNNQYLLVPKPKGGGQVQQQRQHDLLPLGQQLLRQTLLGGRSGVASIHPEQQNWDDGCDAAACVHHQQPALGVDDVRSCGSHLPPAAPTDPAHLGGGSPPNAPAAANTTAAPPTDSAQPGGGSPPDDSAAADAEAAAGTAAADAEMLLVAEVAAAVQHQRRAALVAAFLTLSSYMKGCLQELGLADRLGGSPAAAAVFLLRWPDVFSLQRVPGQQQGGVGSMVLGLKPGAVGWLLRTQHCRRLLDEYRAALVYACIKAEAADLRVLEGRRRVEGNVKQWSWHRQRGVEKDLAASPSGPMPRALLPYRKVGGCWHQV